MRISHEVSSSQSTSEFITTSRVMRAAWRAANDSAGWPPNVHADDGGALDLPGVEQPEQAIGHVAGRLATGPGLAEAHAGPVEGDDRETRGQPRRHLAPDLEVLRIAVQEDQRRPGAEPRHAHAVTIDRLERGREHQPKSSRTRSAARMPEMAQKLTHWPGWVALPAR